MKKKLIFLAINFIFSLWIHGQSQDSIAHTLLVADYDYTCHTLNAQGGKVEVKYGITTQIAQHLACTMGYKRHKGENDKSEQLLYVPTTWQNYPQGQMTSVETIPPYQYLTAEKMPYMKWQLLADRDTICGYICQKAEAQYGGRKWVAWFTEQLPSYFGPWRFQGLPGLILRAVSDDGIHHFECRKVEAVKEKVSYIVPERSIKCGRNKFVKLRNRLFGNPNYLSNPAYYIKAEEIESVTVMNGTMMIGSLPIDMKPAQFQPLDF